MLTSPRPFAIAVRVLLPALAALAFGSQAGAAELQQESRVATGFHRIDIDGTFEVTLVQGDAEGVTVEATAAALPQIRTQVHGGTLVVHGIDRSVWDWFSGRRSGRATRVTIRLREVDRIEASGAVTLDADSLKASELRLDLAGACTIKIRELQATTLLLDGSGAIKVSVGGKVGRQKVDLSGAGSYLAENLVSDEAVVEVSGAGKAVVNAKNSLAVDISGAGRVEYLGDPKLKQSISGIGSISRRKSS
ncbi:MAG TPA: head GIN domain-containing protein [Casimicrobiaceae bacterium]|nr:head GIN domain-containing protein [Casimicrobiaceae bacterium]